ncbi:Hypothetical predicted protein [Mytilus galloprovincialis]|uniref:DZIP3-like HEPN domain-containing protein n=1 Tax=Mytilus galloprovincialis TaxID=29158 RepID=A0A8B6G3U6_MYTGA|nr:Hypothetical predicted protein [Mytilus galloprovincialis]
MATNMTKEEDNFLRIVYLNYRVGTTALRRYFDGVHPNLASDLSSSSNKTLLSNLLNPLRRQRTVLHRDQWNILYPLPGSPLVSSANLDVTLMVCLLRNLPPCVSPPASGFDALPLSNDLSHGAHIARIKYYKNFIVSHSKNGKLSDPVFNRIWIDLEMAIQGLGNQQDVTDAADAKSKVLDYNALKELLNVSFRNLKRLNDFGNELAVQSSKIKKLKSTVKNMEKEKEEHSDLKEKIMKMETEQDEVIPKNIRDQIENEITEWEIKDNMFVSTRASEHVLECLQDNSCLTLTAPSGVGKSFIARHTALVLQKKGYKIIPVIKPDDIRDYYQPGKHTVFIIDDICGNFTANQQQIENWQQLLPVIKTIIADKCCKIIVSCRLQVYRDDKFNILEPFKTCECNLMSDKLCLTAEEKDSMASMYIDSSLDNIDKLSQNSEFFPLLCSLYLREKHGDVKEFFKNPFFVYQTELDSLGRHGDDGNYKICSLALLVLFNNQLKDKWIQGTITRDQQQLIETTCDACGLDRGTSKAKLKEALLTLEGTFVHKQDGIYRTVHDKLFDFIAHYFGQKMIECLIDHADSDLVHERFIWRKSTDDRNSKIDFIIEIPEDYFELYLERFIKDWSTGKVRVAFMNTNLTVSEFRQQLLKHLQNLDKLLQVTLANKCDTVLSKEHHGSGSTPLILTCCNGYTDMLQWMLYNDVDVDQCRGDGLTGLIFASQNGHTDIVKLLLERNPNIDQCDSNGCSPLRLASQEGHTNIVKLLLEKSPNIDLCDNVYGCSPLYMASYNGNTDIVKLLLEKNPNIDLCQKDGCRPLCIASQNGHTDTVTLLLTRNPNIDLCRNDGCGPLYMASKIGHTEIVKLLLERNPNIDLCQKDGCSPLYIASHNGHTDIVKLLLEKNPNIDLCENDRCSPLYIASQNGNTDVVKLLLERNANVDLCRNDGCSPLYMASQEGYIDIVKLLLEKNPNVDICDKDDWTPLRQASKYGHTEIVKLLLEKNPNIDLCDHEGQSPLYIASRVGHTDIVKLLLERNPNIDICSNDGRSPLYMASQEGHTEIVRLLLEKNANVDVCDNDGCSPLYMASQEGYIDTVKLLLEKNPNVDICDKDGWTPLRQASKYGHTEIVKLLLENNPNIDLCDNEGQSPLYIASRVGHTDIVKLLLEKNPNIDICDEDGCSPLFMATLFGHTDIEKLLSKRNPDNDLCDNDV